MKVLGGGRGEGTVGTSGLSVKGPLEDLLIECRSSVGERRRGNGFSKKLFVLMFEDSHNREQLSCTTSKDSL